MANQRYVLLTFSSNQAAILTSAGYGMFSDAVAAGNTAAPAGGYQVIDSWELDRIVADTTGTTPTQKNLRVNQNQTVNVLGATSNLWPV